MYRCNKSKKCPHLFSRSLLPVFIQIIFDWSLIALPSSSPTPAAQDEQIWHRHLLLLSGCSGSPQDESQHWSRSLHTPWYQDRVSEPDDGVWQDTSIITVFKNLPSAIFTILKNNYSFCNCDRSSISLWYSETILLRLLQTISPKVSKEHSTFRRIQSD